MEKVIQKLMILTGKFKLILIGRIYLRGVLSMNYCTGRRSNPKFLTHFAPLCSMKLYPALHIMYLKDIGLLVGIEPAG